MTENLEKVFALVAKGLKYSDINPSGAPRPTHPLLKVAGTGKAWWNPDNERYAV